jgi:hypothetical protein
MTNRKRISNFNEILLRIPYVHLVYVEFTFGNVRDAIVYVR